MSLDLSAGWSCFGLFVLRLLWGVLTQCWCASTCDTGGSLLTWIGSQAKLAHGGKGLVAARLVL